MGFTAILALALALPPPHAAKSLPTLRGLPRGVAAHVEAVLPAPPKTAAELKAIDQRFVAKAKENHWQLCPGTCEMLCLIHPNWQLRPGPAKPGDPYQKPVVEADVKAESGGCASGKCNSSSRSRRRK